MYPIQSYIQKSLVQAMHHALAQTRDFLLVIEAIRSTVYESCL